MTPDPLDPGNGTSAIVIILLTVFVLACTYLYATQ